MPMTISQYHTYGRASIGIVTTVNAHAGNGCADVRRQPTPALGRRATRSARRRSHGAIRDDDSCSLRARVGIEPPQERIRGERAASRLAMMVGGYEVELSPSTVLQVPS